MIHFIVMRPLFIFEYLWVNLPSAEVVPVAQPVASACMEAEGRSQEALGFCFAAELQFAGGISRCRQRRGREVICMLMGVVAFHSSFIPYFVMLK